MMCYEKSCRLCLKDFNRSGIDCTTIEELNNAICLLFDVKILRTDTIKCICNKCFENVMAFKAFKKTILECQKIIHDYETIKKKIHESRAMLSVKEEIIDISESTTNDVPHQNKNKRKKPMHVSQSVTDSEINDILDLVHDSSSSSSTTIRNINNKKPKIDLTSSSASFVNTADQLIKTESDFSSPTLTSRKEPEQMIEPISSTSNTNDNSKIQSNNTNTKRLSESACSTSTSGLGSFLGSQNTTDVKIETSQPHISTADNVSSSVQTSVDCTQTASPSTDSVLTKKRKKGKPEGQDLNKTIDTNNCIENGTKTIETTSSSSPTVEPLSKNWHNCPKCSLHYININELEAHLLKRHNIRKDEIGNLTDTLMKSKQVEKIINREENSFSPSKDVDVTLRTRSTKQTKSQEKRHSSGSTKHQSSQESKPSTSNYYFRKRNSMTPSITDQSCSNQSKETVANTFIDGSEIIQISNNLQRPCDKKRVITITLLRSKESVNFRYFDQFKQTIDFNSVSLEELEDIRSSLLIPKIWENLKNVFKKTPPDNKTMEQLRTLFGNNFEF